jgi:hypothetical protein
MMAEFKVETNVSLPARYRTGNSKYPFKDMHVGDSFEFDDYLRTKVTNSAHIWGKRNGAKFSIRKMPDAPNKCRCWRIA